MRSRLPVWLPTSYLYLLDVLVGAVLTMIYAEFAGKSDAPPWLGYGLAVLIGAPLAVRRRWPLPVLVIVVGALGVATVARITLEPFTPAAFALYMAAACAPRNRSVAALVFSLVVAVASIAFAEPWPDDLGLVGVVAVLLTGSWALGHSTRVRRDYAERTAADRAAKAIADVRLRIARELHDVVAHSLSLITVKAGIANHVADTQPEEAREALAVIESASRGTLVEMRRLLGVLRSEDSAAELEPMPGLADLPGLVERAGMAGVPVDLSVTGGPLPDALGLTVYRIVQESVTNVVKHAAPARCAVEVAVDESSVRISVTDDGPGERVLAGSGGHGLIGMRDAGAGGGVRGHVHGGAAWRRRVPGAGGGAVRVIDVVVVDDQALLRGSFRVLVDSASDLRVVGEAGDGTEAVSVARRTRPRVVLMDVRMPGVDGIAATREIAATSPEARVLILTTFDLDEYVYSALRAGASGFLLKDTPPAELLAAIRVVAEGDGLLSPSVTRRLIAEFAKRPEPRPVRLDGVTDREREVLALIARGLSNAEITRELYVSPGTVKTHIGRLLHKLQARDRAQLVIAAYESGLVSAGGG